MPGSTPRHPFEIIEPARYSADALHLLELSIERAERSESFEGFLASSSEFRGYLGLCGGRGPALRRAPSDPTLSTLADKVGGGKGPCFGHAGVRR